MFRNSFRAVAVVVFTGALTPPVPASAGMDPSSFINNLGDQLQTVTRSASTEQRLAGFQELFRTDFDVPGLGRFVLGRFWRAFTPFEQQEFLSLFERYVVLTYSEKLSDYTEDGGCPRVTGSRPEPDGVIVSSQIVRARTAQPLKVDWRLTAQNGSYKISDIIIEGLSMAANGRSQLEGVVERNGGRPQAILAVMRQQIAGAPVALNRRFSRRHKASRISDKRAKTRLITDGEAGDASCRFTLSGNQNRFRIVNNARRVIGKQKAFADEIIRGRRDRG